MPHTKNSEITVKQAKKELEENNYLIVLDDLGRLVKIAFKKDVENIVVGAAISTHKGWKKRVKACDEAGADIFVIDTSDAYNEFTSKVLKDYAKMKLGKPICAGNVITYEGAKFLMNSGADVIKVGMSSGSICTTQREKALSLIHI